MIYDLNIAEDAFVKAMEGFDAIIVRCNPGQINAAGGQSIIGGMNGWMAKSGEYSYQNINGCYGYRIFSWLFIKCDDIVWYNVMICVYIYMA